MTAHETVLRFQFADDAAARTIERSVRPEVGAIEGDRTRATLSRDGDTVTVVVEARDLVALRAGVNTWSTMVGVAEDAERVASGEML